jgi:hypothetical protein
MTMRIFAIASLTLSAALLGCGARAEVIKPQRDITTIKLAAGDIALLHTAIDLNNAHTMETVSFFQPNARGAAAQIPFDMNGDYQPVLPLRSGADCAISGVRTIRSGERLKVVYALRKGGWAEQQPVTFLVFALERSDGGAPGTPSLYFKQQRKLASKAAYCDVNQALDKETALYGAGAD